MALNTGAEYVAAARTLEALKAGQVVRVTTHSYRRGRGFGTLTRTGKVRTILGPWPDSPDLVHAIFEQIRQDGSYAGRVFHASGKTTLKVEPIG